MRYIVTTDIPANDNYGNYPLSVTEIKGQFTPRDALISMLRDIDSGKSNFEALIVIGMGEQSYKAYGRTKYSNVTDLAMCQLINMVLKNMESGYEDV
jgi:hypothetical protein